VAEALRRAFQIEPDVVSGVEIAGAGFINFRLAPAWLVSNVGRILENPDRYEPPPRAAARRSSSNT